MKILVLVDLMDAPPDTHDYEAWLRSDDWRTEHNVVRALEDLGHTPKLFGIYNDIDPLLHELQRDRPEVVFNLCEAFDRDRRYEPHLMAMLALLKIPYTGSPMEALALSKDKGLSKKILSFHRIRVPHFLVSRQVRPLRSLGRFSAPFFIKPLGLEASEGIAQMSFADNEGEALDRAKYIHQRLKTDAIIEEFIEGRELYVGVLGNEKLTAFPPRELFFDRMPDSELRFATFKAKWDEGYRKRWKIHTDVADLDSRTTRELLETSKKIYRLFGMRGYARIDFRLKPSGEYVFLEANPNPSLARDDDFALGAKAGGVAYSDLIRKIVNLSQ